MILKYCWVFAYGKTGSRMTRNYINFHEEEEEEEEE